MIEFRYVIYKNRATAEKVRAYADEHDIPMALAKQRVRHSYHGRSTPLSSNYVC